MAILAAAVVAHPYTAVTIDQLADALAATDHLTAWQRATDARLAALDQEAQARLATMPDDPSFPDARRLQRVAVLRQRTAIAEQRSTPWIWKNLVTPIPRPVTADHAATLWADRWEGLALHGLGGMTLYVEPHCVVYWDMRWGEVLTDRSSQALFQLAYRGLAAALESPGVLIMPESAYPISGLLDLTIEGATLAEVRQAAEATYGPPAPTLSAIATYPTEGHWYWEAIGPVTPWPDRPAAPGIRTEHAG